MFSYIHPEFNNAFTRHLTLLVEIDYYQFSYCIYNQNTGEISAIKKIIYNPQQKNLFDFERLQEAINNEDMLHCPFAEQHTSIAFSPFTTVPDNYFNAELAGKYLDLVSLPDTDTSVRFESIDALHLNIVFAMHHKLKYFFEKVQPKVIWHFAATSFLANHIQTSDDQQAEIVLLDVKNGYYYLSLFRNNALIFINRFNFSNVEDFMYYILLICEQKQFDRNNLQLYISGEITDDSQLYRELYKFFMHLQFQAIPEFYQMPDISTIPVHSLYTLLGLHQCVSFQEI